MIAKTIIIAGLILIVTGFLLLYFPKLFSWFGNLPGDINIERENSKVFIPLGSMIVISIILTLIFNIVSWIILKLK
jgi:H+/Cl- antiporter ClcA